MKFKWRNNISVCFVVAVLGLSILFFVYLLIHHSADNAYIQIQRRRTFQTIIGFGGSFTDSVGINIKSLSEEMQQKLIESYFGENGLEYNLGRVPIGGCDFSTHIYAYNMDPENDTELTNFSLSSEDHEYKIPFIQKASAMATEKLLIVGSAWAPPGWMKTNGEINGTGILYPENYQSWADYHLKFIEQYNMNNVSIWAITTGNEPINGMIPFVLFNSIGWTPKNLAKWISSNLGPTLKKSEFSLVKILALDDQRILIPLWMDLMAKVNDTMDYIDGIATHWYWDYFIPVEAVNRTSEKYPDKFLISTEASMGYLPNETEKVALGSWTRAESYIHGILESLNHRYVGWIDWNLALDREGGPNWYDHRVDSAIIVMPKDGEFLKQPMFYAMGHFSKFIPRGSKRVDVEGAFHDVEKVAFLRPDGGIAVVIYNSNEKEVVLNLLEEGKGFIATSIPAKSVQSIIYW